MTGASMIPVLMDAEVSKRKFRREVEQLLSIKDDLRKRGWIIEKTEYPLVRVTFIGRHILPRVAVCTTEIDFANYDIVPPSVRFLDPFSFKVAFCGSYDQVPQTEMRSLIKGTYLRDGKPSDIILNHVTDGMPFLCLPGVREYHSHPQHTDDPWEKHRGKLSGHILHYLLDTVDACCIEPFKSVVLTANLSLNLAADKLACAHTYPKSND